MDPSGTMPRIRDTDQTRVCQPSVASNLTHWGDCQLFDTFILKVFFTAFSPILCVYFNQTPGSAAHPQSALVSLTVALAPSPGAGTHPCSVSGPSPTQDSLPTAPPYAYGPGHAPEHKQVDFPIINKGWDTKDSNNLLPYHLHVVNLWFKLQILFL